MEKCCRGVSAKGCAEVLAEVLEICIGEMR